MNAFDSSIRYKCDWLRNPSNISIAQICKHFHLNRIRNCRTTHLFHRNSADEWSVNWAVGRWQHQKKNWQLLAACRTLKRSGMKRNANSERKTITCTGISICRRVWNCFVFDKFFFVWFGWSNFNLYHFQLHLSFRIFCWFSIWALCQCCMLSFDINFSRVVLGGMWQFDLLSNV